jgi:hypothetical protein
MEVNRMSIINHPFWGICPIYGNPQLKKKTLHPAERNQSSWSQACRGWIVGLGCTQLGKGDGLKRMVYPSVPSNMAGETPRNDMNRYKWIYVNI